MTEGLEPHCSRCCPVKPPEPAPEDPTPLGVWLALGLVVVGAVAANAAVILAVVRA